MVARRHISGTERVRGRAAARRTNLRCRGIAMGVEHSLSLPEMVAFDGDVIIIIIKYGLSVLYKTHRICKGFPLRGLRNGKIRAVRDSRV